MYHSCACTYASPPLARARGLDSARSQRHSGTVSNTLLVRVAPRPDASIVWQVQGWPTWNVIRLLWRTQSDQRLSSRPECENIASHPSDLSLSQKYRLCTVYNLCSGRAGAGRSPSEPRDAAQRNGRLLGGKPWAEWGLVDVSETSLPSIRRRRLAHLQGTDYCVQLSWRRKPAADFFLSP